MLSRAAARTTTSLVSRRGFHATRARMSSPYHYPEGPYTNIPFNPRSKYFGLGFWSFMATGFLAPFGIAGASARFCPSRAAPSDMLANWLCSLPDLQGAVSSRRKAGWLVEGEEDTVWSGCPGTFDRRLGCHRYHCKQSSICQSESIRPTRAMPNCNRV